MKRTTRRRNGPADPAPSGLALAGPMTLRAIDLALRAEALSDELDLLIEEVAESWSGWRNSHGGSDLADAAGEIWTLCMHLARTEERPVENGRAVARPRKEARHG